MRRALCGFLNLEADGWSRPEGSLSAALWAHGLEVTVAFIADAEHVQDGLAWVADPRSGHLRSNDLAAVSVGEISVVVDAGRRAVRFVRRDEVKGCGHGKRLPIVRPFLVPDCVLGEHDPLACFETLGWFEMVSAGAVVSAVSARGGVDRCTVETTTVIALASFGLAQPSMTDRERQRATGHDGDPAATAMFKDLQLSPNPLSGFCVVLTLSAEHRPPVRRIPSL